MKINFVIPTPGNTGGLQVIYKYAEEFQKKGHDVRIYSVSYTHLTLPTIA